MNKPYKTLEKIHYSDTSSQRFSTNKELAQCRLTSESSFRTGIMLETGELFFIVPNELSIMNEQVLRAERKVSSLWKNIPPIAQAEQIRNLILGEIIETNEMEGIRSTKKQVKNAIEKAERKSENAKPELYVEFALLYLELLNPQSQNPERPEDIRKIYNAVVEGTIDKKNYPDGALFRASGVEIISKSAKIIHEGVNPEEKIFFMLKEMLSLVNSSAYPQLYSAILSHFLFEYIHPFYDGNGRTGRYLLSKYLGAVLSLPTVLSLSKTIAENKERYYKAFEATENPLNHAEATHFIMVIMGLIKNAQEKLIDSLSKKQKQLEVAQEALRSVEKNYHLSFVESQIIYSAIQSYLFGMKQGIEMSEIVTHVEKSKQTVRKYAKELENKYLIEIEKRKPLSFVLSQTAKRVLNLEEEGY